MCFINPESITGHISGYLVAILAWLFIIICTSFTWYRRAQILSTRARCRLQGCKIQPPKAGPNRSTNRYHEMYFQLQNLESNPTVLEPARAELVGLLSEALSLALQDRNKGILHLDAYNPDRLRTFISREHDTVMNEWASYLEKGHPRLFSTTTEVKKWLSRRAPAKLVDGAWLGHIHKITTPFALREITKGTWQILSEELGDGDLSKNHVYVYQQLLNAVGCALPDPSTREFISPRNLQIMDDPRSWKSAIAQLLISLFPNEFLPEILGFNMHYELISLEVMIAARELKEIGVDPLYFLLHVCIDNADSGHTAMALLNVIDYLDIVKETGREDLQEQWKRVQAGYILSQTLVVSCDGPDNPTYTGEGTSVYPLTAQVISIFKSKTSVSQKYHCQSKARIGSRTLAEWLDPQLWDHDETQKHLELLSALSRSKRWISPGRGRQSRLVQELTWGGRMFGAFTSDEVDVLAAWIDALGFGNKSSTDISPYYTFTGRKPVASRDVVRSLQDPAVHHPVAARASTVKTTILATTPTIIPCFSLDNEQPLNAPSQANIPDVVSLWFAHIGLLENTINVPCRTATSLHSNILLILRAQAGFARETDIPAGTAEMLLPSRDLVRIGLEIVARAGWPDASNPGSSPSCLKEVFTLTRDKGQGEDRAGLAYDMLTWANAPEENLSFLVGLAVAFLGLKEAVRMSGLLGEDSQVGLGMIVQRERKALVRCMVEIVGMGNKHSSELERGYWIGRSALEECLGVKQKDSFLRKVSSLAPRTALPDPHPSSQA